MAKETRQSKKTGSGPESKDRADGRLRKAIDKPIGQPDDAREEAPVGWDFGPDGLPPGVVPGLDDNLPSDTVVVGTSDQRIDSEKAAEDAAPGPASSGRAPEGGAAGSADDPADLQTSSIPGTPGGRTVGSVVGPDTPDIGRPDDGDGSIGAPGPGVITPQSPGGGAYIPGEVGGGPDFPGGGGGSGEGTTPTPPEISGTAAGDVQEDTVVAASGQLTASGSGGLTWSLVGNGVAPYGSFTLGPNGQWSYALDNDKAQGLKAGDTAQEFFTVKVTDANGASVTQVVAVTITGTNDVPVISGTATGLVEEDQIPSVSGVLTASDADIGDNAAWSLTGTGEGGHGTLTLGDDGHWSYELDNSSVQGLKAGETAQDFFTVTVTDTAGASVTQVITVTVAGTNDAPVISSAETGAVDEDGMLTASGQLSSTDADIGDAATWSIVGNGDGSYGTLTLGEDGQWSYALDNDAAQGLKAGETAQEIFTVKVIDASGASDTQTVTVTVSGANDVPVISGTETGSVEEDGTLTASGTLASTDADIGDTASWSIVGSSEGQYGSLVLGDDGAWTYTLDNAATQELKAGDTAQEIFTIQVTDSAGASMTQTVIVTVSGTNDTPVISGAETGSVQEDTALAASGTLTSADADIGDTASWSVVGSSNGSHGSLTLDGDGSWSYALDNDAAQGLRAGETAQDIFTVEVTDASGAFDTQIVTVTITGTNDAPVISGTETGSVQEDGTLSASGALTVTDPDIGDTAAWSIVGAGDGHYGSLILGEDGAWTYTLDNDTAQGLKAGETAQEIFTVKVTDAEGASDTQTITVTVTGTNDAPVISGTETGAVQEDETLTAAGRLTALDPDVGDSASWSVVGDATGSYGALALNADGSWSYVLNNDAAQGLKAGETAQETFTVRATDTDGASTDQTITITVSGTNDLPVISGAGMGAVQEDVTLATSGTLTSTDADIGDTATWTVVGSGDGHYGGLSLGDDGSWTYTLNNDAAQGLRAGDTAQEIFTVKVTDASGASDIQTVTVIITGTNDAPVISGTETGAVQEDGTLNVSGALTSTDADIGDTAGWSVVGDGDGHYGNLILGDDGQWSYALDNDAAQGLKAGETAQDIFTVKVTDASGTSDVQTITVTVTGTNDAPVISGTEIGSVQEDGILDVSGTLTSRDADIGDTAAWAVIGTGDGRYGSLTLGDDGAWTYTLNNDAAQGLRAGETAQEIFTVKVTDASGASDMQTVTVTVTGTNDAPTISGTETGAVQEDRTLGASGTLTATDSDIGDTAAWSIVGDSEGHYGSLTLDDDGAWTYTLDNDAAQGLKAGESAQEIFIVKVTDAAGASDSQTVTVTIIGTNDAPVISGTETGSVEEDGTLSASGALTTTDPDIGDTVAWSVVGSGDGHYGSLTLGDDGTWTYALDNTAAQGLKAGETVQEIFTVKATDAAGADVTQTIAVTVTGTNDAPVISGTATGTVQEDASLTASGTLTVADADVGDTAAWSLLGSSDGHYGSLTLGDDGAWSYALDNGAAQGLKAGETAQEIFTVQASDSAGASTTQTIIVTVTGTNDAPVISGAETGSVQEDGTLSASGALTSTDPDIGDTAAWSVVSSDDGHYGSLTLGDDGAWSYTLDNDAAQGLKAGETAQDIFTVKVTDASGASDMQTVTVTVTGTNDAPVISGAETDAVQEDGTLSASGALAVTDPDIGDTAAWSIVGAGEGHYGHLTLGDDGAWTYTLDNTAAQGLKAGDSTQDIFTVRVTDSAGATSMQTVTVSVAGTNDAPVISGSTTGGVAEDGVQTASGVLTSADADIGDTTTWSIAGAETGTYGSLTIGEDGRWSYTLNNDAAQGLKAGETAQDIFTVKVTDASGASDLQTITLTISGSNDVPAISGTMTGSVQEDGALTAGGSLIASDADIGDTASWSVVGNGAGTYGSLELGTDGQWTYALNNDRAQGLKAGDTAQDIFTVKVTDAAGAETTQTITVTVAGTNDVPTISGTETGTVAEDGTLTAAGRLNVSDADVGDTATWSVVGDGEGAYGGLTLNQDGSWSYALDNDAAQSLKAGDTAQEIFTVKVTDAAGADVMQTITVTVTGTNDAPAISGTETGSVQEDASLTASGSLTVADADVGDTAAWSIVGSDDGRYGSLELGDNGAWTYALNNDAAQGLKAGETAQDIFTVKVTDTSGASDTQTVTVTVTGTNDVPVISGTATGSVQEDGTLTAGGKLDVFDADTGDTATWSIVGGDTGHYGSLTIDGDGHWSYALDNDKAQGLKAGETTQETFTIRVTDAAGANAEQTVTITIGGTNDAPVISGTATGQVQEDVTLTASGTLTASDVDIGDAASWSIDGSAVSDHGVFAIDPNSGHWTFTLDNAIAQGLKAGEVVHETFTVRATDSAGASGTHLVSVDITGTNDGPQVGQALNNMGSMKEDTSITFSADDLLRGAQVTDIDQDHLSITTVGLGGSSAPGTLVNNGNGTWTFTPNHNVSNANADIVFSVSDGHTNVSAHASVAIQPVADPADVSLISSAVQEVIKTGDDADLGRIVAPQLTTKQLSQFTLEFTVVGNSVPESTTGAGPVIVNIGSPPSDKNTLTLWDPANMKVGMSKAGGGDVNIATGINLTDGESHRVTVTFDGATNTVKVYDNGDLALTTTLPKPLPSTLYMVVAEKANTPPTTSKPAGSDYRTNEHFEGTIFNVSMSNKAESADQVAQAPLAEQMKDSLLIDLRAQNDQIVDTTGHNAIKTAGGIDTDALRVDTDLGSAPVGSVVHLDVNTTLEDPNDHLSGLVISGFLAGTVVSDGVHTVTVTGTTQKIDITNWSHDNLTADLPDGVRTSMDLKVTTTTTTQPYATGEVDAQGNPVMATNSATLDEYHTLLVEGAGPPPAQPAEAATAMAMFAAPSSEELGVADAAVVATSATLTDTTGETASSSDDQHAAKSGSTGDSISSADDSHAAHFASADNSTASDGSATDQTADTSADMIVIPGVLAADGDATGTTEPTTVGTQPDETSAVAGAAAVSTGGDGAASATDSQPSVTAIANEGSGGASTGTTESQAASSGATTDSAGSGISGDGDTRAAVLQPDNSGTATGPTDNEAGGGTVAQPHGDGTTATGSAEAGSAETGAIVVPSGGSTVSMGDGMSGNVSVSPQQTSDGAPAGPQAVGQGSGTTAASDVAQPHPSEPVDASGHISFVSVNDWYNPSWGGGYNATFQLTLTDDMLKGGSIEGWSLQIGLDNPNATVSTGWLDGFNGTVSFDPATGVFTNTGQDYQPELHAGDVIQFSIQVQNTGFNQGDFSFSFQDLDPVPDGAIEASSGGDGVIMQASSDMSTDTGAAAAAAALTALGTSALQTQAAAASDDAQTTAQPQAAVATRAESANHTEAGTTDGGKTAASGTDHAQSGPDAATTAVSAALGSQSSTTGRDGRPGADGQKQDDRIQEQEHANGGAGDHDAQARQDATRPSPAAEEHGEHTGHGYAFGHRIHGEEHADRGSDDLAAHGHQPDAASFPPVGRQDGEHAGHGHAFGHDIHEGEHADRGADDLAARAHPDAMPVSLAAGEDNGHGGHGYAFGHDVREWGHGDEGAGNLGVHGHQQDAAPFSSAASAYLGFVVAQPDDHATALPPAEHPTSGADAYVHMAGGFEHAGQEPPPPDHLFADTQIEHGSQSGAEGHDIQHDTSHVDTPAAPEPSPMDDDQHHHHHE
ncbi:VCBS domain-containing protein [Rhizobium mayense]|uniref:VCBS domain-containing protein n=1 Tax=Rhizobium mayense TaxID=1312184 RepID=A0ABT7K5N0_9HYPH|nr:VCBS domain-containing protein [Rhizobium mayense]MDL2403811.1 VCBS domain-containing protein [Rhizobium mayense]